MKYSPHLSSCSGVRNTGNAAVSICSRPPNFSGGFSERKSFIRRNRFSSPIDIRGAAAVRALRPGISAAVAFDVDLESPFVVATAAFTRFLGTAESVLSAAAAAATEFESAAFDLRLRAAESAFFESVLLPAYRSIAITNTSQSVRFVCRYVGMLSGCQVPSKTERQRDVQAMGSVSVA